MFSIEGAGLARTKWVSEADFKDLVAITVSKPPRAGRHQGGRPARALQAPSPEPYWKLRAKGGVHELFFLTTLDQTPRFVETIDSLAAAKAFRRTSGCTCR
jgi:hypothetical protein